MGCAHIFWHFTFQLRKTPENLYYKTVDKDCVTSHRLKWGPLPPNEVGRFSKHVMRKEKVKKEMTGSKNKNRNKKGKLLPKK